MNGEDFEDFFARIYERSRSRRVRPQATVKDLPHESIRFMPGDDEFPLWRIGCRVRLLFKKLKINNYLSLRWALRKRPYFTFSREPPPIIKFDLRLPVVLSEDSSMWKEIWMVI